MSEPGNGDADPSPRSEIALRAAGGALANVTRLLGVMATLRDPVRGCPWDVAQTFASIAPYTIEEAYEVAEACSAGDMPALKDELGDLLLQVVFHARMAEEFDLFAFDDVAGAIADKMVRRHPHVFGADPGAGGDAQWEAIKAAERAAAPDGSALAGVARALPALMRAEKLQKRAARTGFDWPDARGAREKIVEELGEVDRAAGQSEREEEIGDLLFAVVNLARKLDVDPEVALRSANDKFSRRFRQMEASAGAGFEGLTLDGKEAHWRAAKQAERK